VTFDPIVLYIENESCQLIVARLSGIQCREDAVSEDEVEEGWIAQAGDLEVCPGLVHSQSIAGQRPLGAARSVGDDEVSDTGITAELAPARLFPAEVTVIAHLHPYRVEAVVSQALGMRLYCGDPAIPRADLCFQQRMRAAAVAREQDPD